MEERQASTGEVEVVKMIRTNYVVYRQRGGIGEEQLPGAGQIQYWTVIF